MIRRTETLAPRSDGWELLATPIGPEELLDPFRISRASGQPPAGVDGAVTRDGLALGSSIHGVFNSYSLRGVILEHLAEWKGASLPDPSNTGGHLRRHGIPGVRSAHRAVTADMWRLAKVMNFGIIYGLPAHGMSQQTNLDLQESAAFVESYFAKYPGIRFSIEEAKQQARERRYLRLYWAGSASCRR